MSQRDWSILKTLKLQNLESAATATIATTCVFLSLFINRDLAQLLIYNTNTCYFNFDHNNQNLST